MPLPGYKFPSASHWLGVEPVNGRDIFARLVYGARVSLTIALLATLMSVVLGTLLGAMAAYFRGAVDSVISRFMDLLLAFPQLLLILTLDSDPAGADSATRSSARAARCPSCRWC